MNRLRFHFSMAGLLGLVALTTIGCAGAGNGHAASGQRLAHSEFAHLVAGRGGSDRTAG